MDSASAARNDGAGPLTRWPCLQYAPSCPDSAEEEALLMKNSPRGSLTLPSFRYSSSILK